MCLDMRMLAMVSPSRLRAGIRVCIADNDAPPSATEVRERVVDHHHRVSVVKRYQPNRTTMEFVPRSGDICAALYSRGDGVTFHWAFLVIQDQERGFKMHAVDDSSNVWSYQEGLEAFRANPDLVALVKIGSLQEDHSTLEAVQEVLKTRVLIDPAGFRGRFSCRTWFTAGIGELDEYAYVTVPDKFKLENELLQVATTAEMARLRGVRRISECCELSG